MGNTTGGLTMGREGRVAFCVVFPRDLAIEGVAVPGVVPAGNSTGFGGNDGCALDSECD